MIEGTGMTASELLTLLAGAGASLRRLSGDRLEVQGHISESLKQSLCQHKQELLAIFSDPVEEIDRMWPAVIKWANGLLSDCWSGSADHWAELDDVERRFSEAKAAGDAEAARRACDEYIHACQRFRELAAVH